MKQHAELTTKEGTISEGLKRKMSIWEKAGIFDQLAAKVDEAIEELDKEEVIA